MSNYFLFGGLSSFFLTVGLLIGLFAQPKQVPGLRCHRVGVPVRLFSVAGDDLGEFVTAADRIRYRVIGPRPGGAVRRLQRLGMSDNNIWTDEWDPAEDWSGGGGQAKRLPRGEDLGATVYQLGPGNWIPFHFHHAAEELMVVLRGRPTLKAAEGSRTLDEGEALHFPVGPDGAHGVKNETDEPVRFLMASTLRSPEVAEYPDLSQIAVQGRARSQTGERLWFIHDVERDAQ